MKQMRKSVSGKTKQKKKTHKNPQTLHIMIKKNGITGKRGTSGNHMDFCMAGWVRQYVHHVKEFGLYLEKRY